MSVLNSHSLYQKRIGEILIEADLISIPQINVALKAQMHDPHMGNMLLGEILSMRGCIQQETADFFVLDWYNLIKEQSRKPLGWDLQKAKLLKKKILTVF